LTKAPLSIRGRFPLVNRKSRGFPLTGEGGETETSLGEKDCTARKKRKLTHINWPTKKTFTLGEGETSAESKRGLILHKKTKTEVFRKKG